MRASTRSCWAPDIAPVPGVLPAGAIVVADPIVVPGAIVVAEPPVVPGAAVVVALVSLSEPQAASTAAPMIVAPPNLNSVRRVVDGTPSTAAFSSVLIVGSPPTMRSSSARHFGIASSFIRSTARSCATDLVLVHVVRHGGSPGQLNFAGSRPAFGSVPSPSAADSNAPVGKTSASDLPSARPSTTWCWASIGRIDDVALA